MSVKLLLFTMLVAVQHLAEINKATWSGTPGCKIAKILLFFFSFKCTFEIQFETELERDWERGREGVMTSPIMCQCDWQRGS